MKEPADAKKLASASIKLWDGEVKIEKLPIDEIGREHIRFSVWSQEEMLNRPLTLTEKELVTLLQKAIQQGVLSQDFISMLRSFIEI